MLNDSEYTCTGAVSNETVKVCPTMLEEINPFPQDARITFDEGTHTYTVDGKRVPLSVTSLIKTVFNVFDGKAQATRLAGRSNKYAGQTPRQIARSWIDKGSEASMLGTNLHKIIEDFFNGKGWKNDDSLAPELDQAMKFVRMEIDTPGLIPFRTEPRIFVHDDDFLVAGSVDCICYDVKRGQHTIFDWKRTSRFNTDTSRFKGIVGPFSDLCDTNFTKYSIQLHLYAYILNKYYGMNIPPENVYIVVFHFTNECYQKIRALDLSGIVPWFKDNFDYCRDRANEAVCMEQAYRKWALEESEDDKDT